jgi:hypothetical protein
MTGKNKGKGRRGADRPPPPSMHVHQPHFGQVVSISGNGRSVSAPGHIVHTERALPAYIEEDFTTNAAVDSEDFSYDLGDITLVPEVQDLPADGIILQKRKVYENSVR